MNADEIGSLVRKLAVAMLSGTAGTWITSHGLTVDSVGVLAGDLGVILWGVYAHWNMKKVPETAIVTSGEH